ncbi:hypothetical protein COO60DRAFT_517452 [Scenedesmus sp. NREL 46B-D3]|nr:hypothetical protein COO60DRAFT_517452 [Scenedesmus sp. NREL 46B-D3]
MQTCLSRRVQALDSCGGGLLRQRPVISRHHVSLQQQRLVCRAEKGDKLSKPKNKQEEYIEALKKGGVTAQSILDRWKEAGGDADPSQLRKLFLKQSLVPITASLVQLLFDAGAAYSGYMTAGFFALGPAFFGRTALVILLDFLAVYFAFGLLFDIITLTSVLISTVRLGTTPVAFFDAVKAIAAPAGGSVGREGGASTGCNCGTLGDELGWQAWCCWCGWVEGSGNEEHGHAGKPVSIPHPVQVRSWHAVCGYYLLLSCCSCSYVEG